MRVDDLSTVQFVLSQYGLCPKPSCVEWLGNRDGFSGAGLWRITTQSGDFALRRWPNPGMPSNRLMGLHRLLKHLHDNGLSFVACAVRTGTGESLPFAAGHYWQLEPWMPGTADYRTNPARGRLVATMTALAQWHHIASSHIPEPSTEHWFGCREAATSPAVHERLSLLQSIDASTLTRLDLSLSTSEASPLSGNCRSLLALFRESRDRVTNELKMVQAVSFRLQPCLRDIWHNHVLFSDNRVTGVIDPSACRMENVATDLSRLIGSLVGDNRDDWDVAIRAYQEHRTLTTNELALVSVLDRSGTLLSSWTWLDWLLIHKRSFGNLALVENRLNELIPRLEALAGTEAPSNRIILT